MNKKVVKREKEAIKCYDEAIRLDAKYVYAWNGKGKKKEQKVKMVQFTKIEKKRTK